MSTLELQPNDVERCVQLAVVLIPGTESMPAVTSLPSFEGLLRNAVRACGYEDEQIRHAIDALPENISWDSIKVHARENAEEFRVVAVLVSAAYYMAPQVLALLSYPTNRRHPAREDEFADEFGTGILDALMERGPIYVDPRAKIMSRRPDTGVADPDDHERRLQAASSLQEGQNHD